jgi:hypothetical protein
MAAGSHRPLQPHPAPLNANHGPHGVHSEVLEWPGVGSDLHRCGRAWRETPSAVSGSCRLNVSTGRDRNCLSLTRYALYHPEVLAPPGAGPPQMLSCTEVEACPGRHSSRLRFRLLLSPSIMVVLAQIWRRRWPGTAVWRVSYAGAPARVSLFPVQPRAGPADEYLPPARRLNPPQPRKSTASLAFSEWIGLAAARYL